MDSQPKIQPEWVPEAYREQGDDKKQQAKQTQSFSSVNTGFKRVIRKAKPGSAFKACKRG